MDLIWFKDLPGLFSKDNYDVFIPSKELSFNQNLNAVVRLSIYFSILIFIIKQKSTIFMVPLIVMASTYFLYTSNSENKIIEKMFLQKNNYNKNRNTGKICQQPSQNNPFMNVQMGDYIDNPNRPQACNVSQKNVKKEVDKFFNKNLYRSVSDIFNKEASDRQWITNPITTIPNDQASFAKWCYQTPKTCKEGSGNSCWTNTYQKRI